MKFASQIVEDIDRAGLGAGELHRLGDDVESTSRDRASSSPPATLHRARAVLADRAASRFAGAARRVAAFSIAMRLVGESLDQLDLFLGEWA